MAVCCVPEGRSELNSGYNFSRAAGASPSPARRRAGDDGLLPTSAVPLLRGFAKFCGFVSSSGSCVERLSRGRRPFFRSSNRLHIIIINTSTRHHVARMRSIIQHAPSPPLHLASRSVTERPHIIISSTSYGSERLTPPLITDRTSHRTDSPVPSRRPTNHHTFVSTPSSRLRPPATQWRGLRPKLKLRFALRGLSGSSPPPSCPYHSPSPPA